VTLICCKKLHATSNRKLVGIQIIRTRFLKAYKFGAPFQIFYKYELKLSFFFTKIHLKQNPMPHQIRIQLKIIKYNFF